MVVKIRSSPVDRREDPSSFTTFSYKKSTALYCFILVINEEKLRRILMG
jgi:hypothetical protein